MVFTPRSLGSTTPALQTRSGPGWREIGAEGGRRWGQDFYRIKRLEGLEQANCENIWSWTLGHCLEALRRISNDLQVRACRKIRKGEEVRTQTLSSWKNNLTLILNQTNHLGNPLTNILCDGPGFFLIHPTRRCLLNKVFYLNETMMHWHRLKENVKACPNVKGRKRRKAEELVSSLCLPCLLRTGSEAWTQWSDKKRTGCTSQSSIFEILQI